MIAALVFAAAANAVSIVATDYALAMPTRLPSGLTTFVMSNRGSEPHDVRFLKLGKGRTLDDFLAWQKSGDPIPDWLATVGGIGTLAPGMTEEYSTSLAPGSYVALCSYVAADGVTHSTKGMRVALEVGPDASSDRPPAEADVNLRLHDHGFQLSAPIEGGRKLWHVRNTGGDPHQVLLIQLPEGASEYQERGWFSGGGRGTRVGIPTGGVLEIEPDAEAWFQIELKPGRYIMLCSVQEEEGRHYDLGMIYRFTIE